MDAQVDLSLRLAHRSFVGFAVRRLNLFQGIKGIDSPARERASCVQCFNWSRLCQAPNSEKVIMALSLELSGIL